MGTGEGKRERERDYIARTCSCCPTASKAPNIGGPNGPGGLTLPLHPKEEDYIALTLAKESILPFSGASLSTGVVALVVQLFSLPVGGATARGLGGNPWPQILTKERKSMLSFGGVLSRQIRGNVDDTHPERALPTHRRAPQG